MTLQVLQRTRAIDPFYIPVVAIMWSPADASKEDIAKLASKLHYLTFPDDIVRNAEVEALAFILAD